ncbi:9439_t:CDS:1 [Ambispora leptoticha]|uniref:9439_t:CDS:1 n=1 Tax=Ambispora leptoticha TaxID=144679 RepID=A0A9N9G3P2_9GLOM|nr:9439_t:CDS:1 [Ambispora leptoticha]
MNPEETIINNFFNLMLGAQPIRRTRQQLLDNQERWINHLENIRKKNLVNFETTNSTFANKKANTVDVELVPKNRISISQLQINKVHTGKFLLCRVITKCAKSTALAMVIEDLEGEAERLALHNYIPVNKIPPGGLSVEQASRFLPIGTILAIQNPYYKISQDGQTSLRSDNPNEIVIIKSNDKLLTQFRWKTNIELPRHSGIETSKILSADDFRIRGNEYFGKKDFMSAFDEYSHGIELDPQNVTLYANRSEVHLRLSQFKEALDDAETALKIDSKHPKAAIRKGKALMHLKRYTESVNTFCTLLKDEAVNTLDKKLGKEIEEYRKQAQELDSENKHGNYNYIKIINEYLKKIETREINFGTKEWVHLGGPRLDHADYVSNVIEIKQVGKKGRGWVANNDIPQHTLLMVSKAFEIVFNQETRTCMNTNSSTKIMKEATNTELLTSIVQKLRVEPTLAREIYDLYAGPESIHTTSPGKISSKSVDVERIEKIIFYNAFQSEFMWEIFNQKIDHGCFGSGIWIKPSYFNHSCIDTNVQRIYLGDLMFVRAQRPIKKGEELTLFYTDPVEPFEKRTKTLQKFGINCQCRLCKLERAESNKVKQLRVKIQERFNSDITPPQFEGVSLDSLIAELESLIEELESLRPKNYDLDFSLMNVKTALSIAYHKNGSFTKSITILEQLHHLTKKHNLFHYSYRFSSLLAYSYTITAKVEKAKEYFKLALYEMIAPIIGNFDVSDSQIRSDVLLIAEKLNMPHINEAKLAGLMD